MFLKEIENEDYAEKYRRWAEYLRVEGQSDNYLQVLGIFLEYFPFNCHYWTEYIQLTRFEEYHIALKRNPKSYELWTAYLLTCKSMFYEQDKQKYKKELENAIMEVGADSRALPLY